MDIHDLINDLIDKLEDRNELGEAVYEKYGSVGLDFLNDLIAHVQVIRYHYPDAAYDLLNKYYRW